MSILSMQYIHNKKAKSDAAASPLPAPFFLRPEPRDGYHFFSPCEIKRSSERLFFSDCAGALRGFPPAGVGSGEPKGVEAREGRQAPLPTDRRETISGRVPRNERRAE